MKVVGKVLLIIGSILFLASAIYSIIDITRYFLNGNIPADWTAWTVLITTSVSVLVLLLGGLGGLFYVTGHGPFRGWVSVISIILIVLWIINLVACIGTFSKGDADFWTTFKNIFYMGVPEALYVVGYILCKKK